MKRIGPKMLQAALYVAQHPGCAIRPAAHAVTPNPDPTTNEALGYDIVHRAIKAGLIRAEAGAKRGTYALYRQEE
jgi:hypothetical protein